MDTDTYWSELESPFLTESAGDQPAGRVVGSPLRFESPRTPTRSAGFPPPSSVPPGWRDHFPPNPLGPAEAAALIASNPAITLYTTTKTPGKGADPASNIRDTAAGLQATRSSGPGLPGGTVMLDIAMLKAMNALTRAPYSYTFRVTAIAGGKHETNSRHYAGTTFDVDMIHGAAVNENHPTYKAFMQACKDLGATLVGGPPTEGHHHHVHAAWPRPVAPSNELEASSCEVSEQQTSEFETNEESVAQTPTLISIAQLQPGDIIVSTTTQLLSQVIRKSQGDIVSHSIIYIGEGQVIEMIWPKAIRRTVASAIAQSSYALVLRYPDLGLGRQGVITGFAIKTWKEGRKFDFWGMVRTGFGAKKSGDRKFFCSELVLKAYDKASIKLFDRKMPTPGDLHELEGTALQYVGHLKVNATARELEMSLLGEMDHFVDPAAGYGTSEVELYEGPAPSTMQWESEIVSAENGEAPTASLPRYEHETPVTVGGEVGEYIALVQKVEKANPTWSSEDVLNALRGVAGTDNHLFQLLFGTQPARPIVPVAPYPTVVLTKEDISKLQRLSRHTLVNGVQQGNAKDALGYDVSLGHVLTGLSAGQHRNRNANLVARKVGLGDPPIRCPFDVDNLFAATMSGDLGQTAALATHVGGSATIGVGTEATEAELIGDIDGYVLGHAGGLLGRRVSDVLRAYYGVDACAPAGFNAARRFANFARHGTKELPDQTQRFAVNYFVYTWRQQRSLDKDLGQQVGRVLSAFSVWLNRMASTEANACAVLRRSGIAGQKLFEAEFDGEEPNAKLSGAGWWDRNQAQYGYSLSIDALESTFREKVKAFVAALNAGGATVTVKTTTRTAERAYLMHYAWRIAKGLVLASVVPARPGVDIVWDHDDLKKSTDAAKEMVARFGMTAEAVLDTKHAVGKAIDMTISWSGTIKVKKNDGTIVDVTFMSDVDKNTTLHEVGRSYGVIKLLSTKNPDPPHWSTDGT
jgi:hypothetical protein